MALGMDFGERKRSPYMERRDRTFRRTGGRPPDVGQGQPPGGTTTQGAAQAGEATTPTGSGIQETQKQTPYAGFLKSLAQPIEYQDRSQQRFNLARGQIQAGTKMQMGQMEKYMGGKGFRGGESGIADTAMGRIARGGAERMGQVTGQIAESEAERGYGYAGLNLQRQLGGGQMALAGEEGALNRMMQYYGGQQQAEQRQWQPWWQGLSQGGGY